MTITTTPTTPPAPRSNPAVEGLNQVRQKLSMRIQQGQQILESTTDPEVVSYVEYNNSLLYDRMVQLDSMIDSVRRGEKFNLGKLLK